MAASCAHDIVTWPRSGKIPGVKAEKIATPKICRHPNYVERRRISALSGSGKPDGQIAHRLGRDPAAVW